MRTVREVLDQDEEFRGRVVSGILEKDLDRASWLFLTRPEGWAYEYELLLEAAAEEARADSENAESNSAQRKLEHVESTLDKTRQQLAAARAQLESTEAELGDAREWHSKLQSESNELRSRVVELEAERSTVIRN
ncbi:MAG TPA: hypothetical protein VL068_05635, partial [Microthrixaceae bacterium]|nr:hypothetical protein [Microthrixaceae bacterium]